MGTEVELQKVALQSGDSHEVTVQQSPSRAATAVDGPWRQVVERHHAALLNELGPRFEADVASAVFQAVTQAITDERAQSAGQLERARAQARSTQAESLNQVMRRLRAASENELLDLLARSAASNGASQVVVLLFENGQAQVVASQGITSAPNGSAAENALKTEDVPAIISAIESKDPVVSLATPGEISSTLADLFNAPRNEPAKAYLFPIVVRQSVMAMLVAMGVELSAPIEMLCEAAGMRLESVNASASKVPDITTRQVPASETSGPRSWNELSPEDQKLHLQAQRTARVRVAEMRLSQQNELDAGIARSDIYGSLRPQIDKARDEFLQMFLSRSPTMVDYLHLEILRSLAHDDDRLLGTNYPGPMV